MPIAAPKKKGKQKELFDTEWTKDRIEENKLVNKIRRRVALWRQGGYVGVTPTTLRLLRYWTEPGREKKKNKAAKVATARTLWIPAVNDHGGFGRWAFIEIADPRDAQNAIQQKLASLSHGTV